MWTRCFCSSKGCLVKYHHRLNGHELQQTAGDSGEQGGLACCSPRGCKESDATERRNNKGCLGARASRPRGEAIFQPRVLCGTSAWERTIMLVNDHTSHQPQASGLFLKHLQNHDNYLHFHLKHLENLNSRRGHLISFWERNSCTFSPPWRFHIGKQPPKGQ